jgi:hypothetical protein
MGDEIQAVVNAQGWDATSLMDLALTYIARQGDDSAFLDYLQECAAEENAAETLGSCGCVDYHLADCPLRQP